MTTTELENETPAAPELPATPDQEKEERRRRLMLLLLLLLLLLCCGASLLFLRYILKPQPISEILLPPKVLQVPPTYVKMITGLDGPMGVAVSPDAQQIYATESKGESLIKVFNRDGNLLFSFFPPGTTKANRNLTYIAVGADGRVYVSEHYNGVIDIFDADGNFIDAIIARDMTLSKYLRSKGKLLLPPGSLFYYDNANKQVYYQTPGGNLTAIPGPNRKDWAPLGVRFDAAGNLLLTNLVDGLHEVLIIPADALQGDLSTYAPKLQEFGTEGGEAGQFSFPNSVVRDKAGNYYVSDGNNGRLSAWNSELKYQTFFGFGSSESSLNLPRGIWMDNKDRLHVADAIGSVIRVYDVSGSEPSFLFNFGEFGVSEGSLNFPEDVCMDSTGRVYIADRENNRIDIWSY